MQQSSKDHKNDLSLPFCRLRMKTAINIDCIKVCPFDEQLWAFAFYQQLPNFCGGIQILRTNQLLNEKEVGLGSGETYVELGPLMHIEWLQNKEQGKQETKEYYILAAARCDEALFCAYQPGKRNLELRKRIVLQAGIFCLYCDWRINEDQKRITAIVSTNESSVFAFNASLINGKIDDIQIDNYSKHQYAVWACKISPYPSKQTLMVVGDEVDCLYLYDLRNKNLMGKNKKAHTQGICEIVWMDSETILTGSFDGSIAMISVKNFAETMMKVELEGTIWRILPFSSSKQRSKWDHLLICNSSEKQFQVVSRTQKKIIWNSASEHNSLAYAAQFNRKILITASFYDQQVRLWTVK